jgi:hypothetical protein
MKNGRSRRDRRVILRGEAWRKLTGCCALLLFWATSPGWSAGDNPNGPALIRDMVGMWTVEEWLWPSPGAEAISLPPAVANRQLVGNDFVQEFMSTPAGVKEPFTRVSYFGYNGVNRQFEYFSLDTRAPQMMNERSDGTGAQASDPGPLNLPGGTFVVPQWGPYNNAAFRYRLVVGRIEDRRQTVELYLTPVSANAEKEFLAMRYLYTRGP